MDRSLSKIKDVDQKILSELDDKSLLEFCKTHKYGNKLCEDEEFWHRRLNTTFGRQNKDVGRSWKDFYLKIVYYLDKYKDKNEALFSLSTKGMKNKDLVDFFLVRGANIDAGLLGASKGGHKNLVEYLVYRGAKDFINGYLYAKAAGNKELVKYFREKGLRIFEVDL